MDILYENLVTIGLLVFGVVILAALLVALVSAMLDVEKMQATKARLNRESHERQTAFIERADKAYLASLTKAKAYAEKKAGENNISLERYYEKIDEKWLDDFLTSHRKVYPDEHVKGVHISKVDKS